MIDIIYLLVIMDKHIKIYSINDKYCFTVNKFSSLHHSQLTKAASPDYRYAWEAYRDAKAIATKFAYHVDALEKFAFEDLQKPVVDDVAAERKLADHYDEIYNDLVDIADGMDPEDKLQKRVNYHEAKAVVKEILFIIDKVPEDELADEEEQTESIARLEEVISKIKKLVHDNYPEDLEKDKKDEKEKGDEVPPMEGMPPDPMAGLPPDPMGGGMGGGMPPPMASSQSLVKVASIDKLDRLDKEIVSSLLEEYGCRVCSAIEKKHPDAVYKTQKDAIMVVGKNGPLVRVSIGDDLFVNSIMPSESLAEVCPYQSLEFYQAYWKPIVEKVGHCCIDDHSTILYLDDKVLPDIPKEFPFESNRFQSINKNSKTIKPVSVLFKGKKPSWFVSPCSLSKSAGASNYTEEEYFQNGKGAMVVCTSPELKSYYQNTGSVVQVIPFDNHVEVDINFGNHICRMTEDQFEIIDGL
jgi:hypothetical protein